MRLVVLETETVNERECMSVFSRPSVYEQDEKLTTTGRFPYTYNGIPDWVFEEEIFEASKALWWSPEGTKIVWGFFNDTNVQDYTLLKYGSYKKVQQYPDEQQVPYPKVRERRNGSGQLV
jgi:hypothetical protein